MEFLETEGNNSTSTGCSELQLEQKYTPFALSALCLISFIISIPGVALGLQQYCIRNNISDLRTERLLFHMLCVASVFSLAGSFQWIAHYRKNTTIAQLCSVLGYVWLVAGIFLAVITFCIGIHFFIQLCHIRHFNVQREEKMLKYKKLEYIYLTSAVVLSLVLSPWPFVDHSFGYNRWICWINIRKRCSKDYTDVGFVEVTGLYIMITLTFLFTLSVVIAVQVLICLKKRSTRNLYVPVFLTYLVVSLIVIVVIMIVNLPPNQAVRSIDMVQGITTIAIGIAPLTASLVTSVAVVYKVVQQRHMSRKLFRHSQSQYQAIPDSVPISNDKSPLSINSSTRSTYWDSPATEQINSSHMTDYH